MLALGGLIVRPPASLGAAPTPVLTVIFAPTETAVPLPTAAPESATPTATAPPASGQGIQVGDLVEVFGTGGDGLRLRADPDLRSPVLALGVDSEVFQVDQGPTQADDFEWWHLVNPYDTAKSGWAVGAYLTPLDTP
jgi:hypothetical protein